MSRNGDFTYKPQANGPLAPLVLSRQILLQRVRQMEEDRDARVDLSCEPDLIDFPAFAWTFFGANVNAEDIVEEAEDDDSELWLVGGECNDAHLPDEIEEQWEQWAVEETTAYWVEDTFRRRFPHLWDDVKVAEEKTVTSAHCGCSGFGAGQKYKVVYHYDFDWNRGRRGHDDTVMSKKAACDRRIRSGRNQKTLSTNRETDWLWSNHWDPNFADFDGQLWFHKRADEARYYAGLMRTIGPELKAEWAECNSPTWDVYQVVIDEEDMLEALLDKSIDHYAHHLAYEDSFDDDDYDSYTYDDYLNDSFCNFYDYVDYEEVERLEAAYWDEMIISPEDIDAMIDHQEEERERFLETLSISHSGGHRGVRAVKAAARNLSRVHHFLEVA